MSVPLAASQDSQRPPHPSLYLPGAGAVAETQEPAWSEDTLAGRGDVWLGVRLALGLAQLTRSGDRRPRGLLAVPQKRRPVRMRKRRPVVSKPAPVLSGPEAGPTDACRSRTGASWCGGWETHTRLGHPDLCPKDIESPGLVGTWALFYRRDSVSESVTQHPGDRAAHSAATLGLLTGRAAWDKLLPTQPCDGHHPSAGLVTSPTGDLGKGHLGRSLCSLWLPQETLTNGAPRVRKGAGSRASRPTRLPARGGWVSQAQRGNRSPSRLGVGAPQKDGGRDAPPPPAVPTQTPGRPHPCAGGGDLPPA